MVERTHVLSASERAATQPAEGPASVSTAATGVRRFHAGMVLGERYRLVAPLGKGGMGEVWEAQHTMLGRTVAIKLVLGSAADSELAQRLQREAELVARLEHPNIVGVTDFGLVAAHQPFVVMERLHGRTLAELLLERGKLPWHEARDIAVQIAAGLACAHEAGIVHRDLKPSNVFVVDDASGRLRIKIIDFGLAKATVIGPGDRALTKSGAVFGSPAYMAPEQVRGEAVDARTDLYAFGAIVYEMIVGERLWTRGSIPALLYCHLFEPAPTIRARHPEVPIDLDVLVACCLCKDTNLRPRDTEVLRQALVGVGTGKGGTMPPNETLPMPAPGVRERYATAPATDPVPEPVRVPEPVPVAVVRTRPRRAWLVPTVIAGVLALAVITTIALPHLRKRGRKHTPIEARPTEVPSVAIAPSEARPSSPASTAAPAITPEPPRIAPIATPPEPEPTDTKRTRTRKRSRTRAAEPETPATPTPKPVPKRKGETLDWPSQ